MNFIEDKFPSTIIIGYLSLNIAFFFFSNFTTILPVKYWDSYCQVIINFFTNNNSILITIGSILIGIYFTVFSILGSLNINSTFAMISRENFLKLIKFILHSFISSVFFIIFMLIIYALPTSILAYYLIVLLFPLLIYIFCSSIRLGIYLFLIYRQEIDTLHKKLEEEELKHDELDDVVQRLKVFLNDYEENKEHEYLNKRQK